MTSDAETRWGLRVIGECDVDGTSYVAYTDECYTWICEEEDFRSPTDETDYSLWCADSCPGECDPTIVARIAAACGLDGANVAGSGRWVAAASEEETRR